MRAHRTMSIHAVAGVLFGATALGVPALPGLGELVGPSFAFAQDTTRIASPVLLKRLAEAVDGHRSGQLIYVVASYESPHHVLGSFERESDAREQARNAGGMFDVFGPYRSNRDPVLSPIFIARCIHNIYTSEMAPRICPEGPFIRLSDVDSVSLAVRLRDGTVRTIPLPRGTDAAFFSLPAIDKFAIPYYARIIGVEATAAMRADIVRRLSAP